MPPRDLLLAVLTALIWGLSFIAIHYGINAFPPLMACALRFFFSAVPLVFFVPRPQIPWRYIFGVGFLIGVVQFPLVFLGMDVGVSPGLASLLLQSQAFFTVILAAWLLRERPTRHQIIGLVLAFGGIALIATTVEGGATLAGIGLIVLAGLVWSLSNLVIRRSGARNMVHLMIWMSLVPPVPLALLSLAVDGVAANRAAFAQLDMTGVAAILYLSLIATILGFAAWGRLIRLHGAGRVAPFSLLVPVFGIAASALILGEAFGPLRSLAAAMVMGGLALSALGPRLGRRR